MFVPFRLSVGNVPEWDSVCLFVGCIYFAFVLVCIQDLCGACVLDTSALVGYKHAQGQWSDGGYVAVVVGTRA